MGIGKAGGIVALIGGIFAALAALRYVLVLDLGSVLGADNDAVSATKLVLVGVPVLTIVLGSIAIAKPGDIVGWLLRIVSGYGLYFSWQRNMDLYLAAMLLAFIGGWIADSEDKKSERVRAHTRLAPAWVPPPPPPPPPARINPPPPDFAAQTLLTASTPPVPPPPRSEPLLNPFTAQSVKERPTPPPDRPSNVA